MILQQRYMRYSCLFEIMPSYVQETSQNIFIKEAKNSKPKMERCSPKHFKDEHLCCGRN